MISVSIFIYYLSLPHKILILLTSRTPTPLFIANPLEPFPSVPERNANF